MRSVLKSTLPLLAGTAIIVAAVSFLPKTATCDSFSVVDQRELFLAEEALDLAVSSDGRWTFLLTEDGSVAVYDHTGKRIQVLKVGKGYDTIEYSPAGNKLLLGSSGQKKLKILTLSMIFELDYTGSPFKGSRDAPVTIAAFDDFQ